MTLNGWRLQMASNRSATRVMFIVRCGSTSQTLWECVSEQRWSWWKRRTKKVEESFGSAYCYQMFTVLQILHQPLFHVLVMLIGMSLSHSWPCRKQWSLLFCEFLFTLFPTECPRIFITIILEHSEHICFYTFVEVMSTVSVGPISCYNVLVTFWNFQETLKISSYEAQHGIKENFFNS